MQTVREMLDGIDAAALQERTGAPLAFASDCGALTAPAMATD